ncbi:MAG: 50S ribosomal protein L6 [Candidatus Pacebacteria bacterium]|nr:50S ribosomal protein L6 [Candidatus Paceibacterota bacterium]
MSRIGKKPILIPQGVEVKKDGRKITVKGPKGTIIQDIPEEISVEQKDSQILVKPVRENKKSRELWGLIRSLLQNHVQGVCAGFEKKLEMVGVGYKAALVDPKTIKIEAGFSHPVIMPLPEGLTATVEKNVITVVGFDKQKVGQFAAKIRDVRPPEPYKGKGIRYQGEKVRRKEGKKAATAK